MDYEPAHQHSGAELAPQACGSCRKQKRKCDKQLPICSLCQRIGRVCDYTAESQTTLATPEAFAALQDQVANLEQLLRTATQNGGSFTSSSINGNNSNGHSRSNGSTNGSNNTFNTSDSTSNSSNSPLTLLSPTTLPPFHNPQTFPSLLFLDSNAFEYERFQIHAPSVKVPPGALHALGSSAQLREMIEQYFATVHNHFPIISKIRLYQHLANPLHEPGADIALLFLAMKLICSEIPEGMLPQTQLYQDVKSFYTYVESQNGFSIQLIQTLCLIALYEIGHAVYPAAYLSVGNCARLGHAMGLHAGTAHIPGNVDQNFRVPQMLPRCNTWTEMEERRRVWWGVIILDRFINIGHRGKPFASSDPSLSTHLPTDDAAWDRGQMLVAAPLSLSASQTIRVSPFARTCQAAHLLGKIIHHIDDKQLPVAYRFEEALQLNRTMRALADVLPDELPSCESGTPPNEDTDPTVRPSLCVSMAMCYSALLTMYDSYSCTDRALSVDQDVGEEQLRIQKESIDGLSEISGRVVNLTRMIRRVLEGKGVGVLSPMVVDCVYQAAANYAWYVRETSDPACGDRLQELKELLFMLDRRWKVAGQYLFNLGEFWDRVDDQIPIP